jgi:hypothetical protein
MKKILSIILAILLFAAPGFTEPPRYAGMAPATETQAGSVELATDAETVTGSATGVVTTPANITARLAAPGSVGLTTAIPEISIAAANNARAIVDTHYETIYVPAASTTPLATNGAVGGTYEYATNDINIDYMTFDGATEQYVGFLTPFPEGWDRSTIKAKFAWSSATGSTSGDTVEWEILCGALSDSDAIDAALGTAQVISDALLADNGGDLQISPATPALTVGGTPALGDMIYCKTSRNVGGTDNMTENAWLFGVWIQLKVNNAVAAW